MLPNDTRNYFQKVKIFTMKEEAIHHLPTRCGRVGRKKEGNERRHSKTLYIDITSHV